MSCLRYLVFQNWRVETSETFFLTVTQYKTIKNKMAEENKTWWFGRFKIIVSSSQVILGNLNIFYEYLWLFYKVMFPVLPMILLLILMWFYLKGIEPEQYHLTLYQSCKINLWNCEFVKLWSCDCEKSQFHNTTQFDFLSMHHNHNTTQSIFKDLHNFTNCEKLWNRWKIPLSYLEFGHFWNFSEFFSKNTDRKEQLKILKRDILFFESYNNFRQIHLF